MKIEPQESKVTLKGAGIEAPKKLRVRPNVRAGAGFHRFG